MGPTTTCAAHPTSVVDHSASCPRAGSTPCVTPGSARSRSTWRGRGGARGRGRAMGRGRGRGRGRAAGGPGAGTVAATGRASDCCGARARAARCPRRPAFLGVGPERCVEAERWRALAGAIAGRAASVRASPALELAVRSACTECDTAAASTARTRPASWGRWVRSRDIAVEPSSVQRSWCARRHGADALSRARQESARSRVWWAQSAPARPAGRRPCSAGAPRGGQPA